VAESHDGTFAFWLILTSLFLGPKPLVTMLVGRRKSWLLAVYGRLSCRALICCSFIRSLRCGVEGGDAYAIGVIEVLLAGAYEGAEPGDTTHTKTVLARLTCWTALPASGETVGSA
jgi:hypothetical protein